MASSAGFWSGAAFAVAAVVGGAAALPALLLQPAPQDEKTVTAKPAVSTTDTGSWRPNARVPERKAVATAPERPAKALNSVAATALGAPAAPQPARPATTGAEPEPVQTPRVSVKPTAPVPAAQPTETSGARPAPTAPVQQADAPASTRQAEAPASTRQTEPPAPTQQAAVETKPDAEPAAEPSRAEKRKIARRRAAKRNRDRVRDRGRDDLSHLPVVSAHRLPPGYRIVRPAPFPMREFYSRSYYSRSFY